MFYVLAADLISVLIPSRKRTRELGSAVKSLRRLTADPDSIEILVAADPDDEDTILAAKELNVVLHVAPQRYGYPGLHHYYNFLASQASGEWLFVFNDDTRIRTPGWDDIIRNSPPAILHPEIDYVPEHNSFPILPLQWVKLLGHLSPSEGVDLWIHDVGRITGTTLRIPVRIHHARTTTDITAVERDARDVKAELASFNSEEASRARLEDAMKLQAFLGGPPLDPDNTPVTHYELKAG